MFSAPAFIRFVLQTRRVPSGDAMLKQCKTNRANAENIGNLRYCCSQTPDLPRAPQPLLNPPYFRFKLYRCSQTLCLLADTRAKYASTGNNKKKVTSDSSSKVTLIIPKYTSFILLQLLLKELSFYTSRTYISLNIYGNSARSSSLLDILFPSAHPLHSPHSECEDSSVPNHSVRNRNDG